MSQDNNSTFAVRPLGKYGHVYLLGRDTYTLYSWFTGCAVAIILMGFVYQIVAPLFFPEAPAVNTIRENLLLIAIVAVVIAVKIASHGVISPQHADEVALFPFSRTIHGLTKLLIIAGLLLSGLLALVLGVSTAINLVFGGAKLEHGVILAVLLGLVWIFNKARRKLK